MSTIGSRKEIEGSKHVVIENNPQAIGTERGYNVVFEGTGEKNSNHFGIRTWTSFRDKEDFIQWMMESGNGDTVLVEGVTQDEALSYTRQTRLEDRTTAIEAEATTEDGGIDPIILKRQLTNLILLDRFRSGQ